MIQFDEVSVSFGSVEALKRVSLVVERGALCVLVGPSGAGKSTLMRLVNRMVPLEEGMVRVRGEDIRDLDPVALRRSIGYVIQSIGLFPHRTVEDNIATVPRLLGWSRPVIQERVKAMLDLVGLNVPDMASRYPENLSGGQAQRIGLARALAADPDILLMDEPFGAADPITRQSLRIELQRIHKETGKTILLVTHDPAEALELATTIVVMRDGQKVAAGSALSMTEDNNAPFVKALFGHDSAFRRLRFSNVADLAEEGQGSDHGISATADAGEAFSLMLAKRVSSLTVIDQGLPIGRITLDAIVERHQ